MQYNVCMCNTGERLPMVSWGLNAYLARKQSRPEPDRELLVLGIDYCIVSSTHGSGRGLSRAVCMRVARERVGGSES